MQKTDTFWMSALWGRIGAVLILIVGTMLQGRGIDVTQEQMDEANTLISNLINNAHIAVAAILMVVSKFREQSRSRAAQIKAANGQRGRCSLSMLLLLSILMGAATGAVIICLTGCAQPTATRQISAQTNNPGTIALATFTDAQDAYIAAAELYKPYQAAIKQRDQALDAQIIDIFRQANKILTDWELFGSVPIGDKEAFRAYLREISIRAAQAAGK